MIARTRFHAGGLPSTSITATCAETLEPSCSGLSVCVFVAAACSADSTPDGETAGAEAKLESALEVHARGRLEEAVRLYQQVFALDPENKFAYYNLGLVDQTEGRTDAAAANYTEGADHRSRIRASAVQPGDHPSRPGLVRRAHRALPPRPGGEPR